MVRRCLVSVFTFSLVALTFVGQFPVVAERNLGIDERSTAYGVLYACFGAGAVIGALSIGTVFANRSKARIVRVALVAYAVSLTVFALLRDPAPAYPVVVVVGLTYFAFITSLSTVLQEQLARPRAGPGHGAVDHGVRRHGAGRQPPGGAGHRRHLDHRSSCWSVPPAPWGSPATPGCTRLAAGARPARTAGAAGSAEQVDQALEAGDPAALQQHGVAVAEDPGPPTPADAVHRGAAVGGAATATTSMPRSRAISPMAACSASLVGPSSAMSPRTATRRRASSAARDRRAAAIDVGLAL